MKDSKPVFIVGMPRSGTTLLQLIITNHSKIAIAPETHFFRLFWNKRRKYGDLHKNQNFERIYNDLINCQYIKNLDINNYKEIIKRADRERFYQSTFKTLMKEFANQQGKEIFGEKTPSHLEYVEDIFYFFSNARIINIYRNPFDVVASIKRVPWSTNKTRAILNRWKRYINLANKYKRKFKGYFYNIKYEDLVMNPEYEVKSLCKFLSVDFESSMLKYYQKNEINIFNKDKYWHKSALEQISSEYIGKGFKQMNLGDILFVEFYCEKYLKSLEYKHLLDRIEEIIQSRKEEKLCGRSNLNRFGYKILKNSILFKELFIIIKNYKESYTK